MASGAAKHLTLRVQGSPPAGLFMGQIGDSESEKKREKILESKNLSKNKTGGFKGGFS